MSNKNKKKQSPLSLLLLLLCLAVAGFSAWKLYGYYRGYHDGEKEYEDLQQYVEETGEDDSDKKGKQARCPIKVDFDALRAINEDVVAWVYIKDTGINYPVVQGEDNAYYLHHTFEKKDNFSGAIFMDVTCSRDFTSDNSILFGHNLKTGEMFGMLKNLYDTEYNAEADYKEHPAIWVVTPDAAMKYRIFAAREISATTDTDVYMVDFALPEDYQAWLAKQKGASLYETDTDISSGEPMLTLSTCTSDSEDGRFVVQAIRVQNTGV